MVSPDCIYTPRPPKGTTLDVTLGCNPLKNFPAKSCKGTPTKEKGTPQGIRGIQICEKVDETKDSPMMGKEPQAPKDTPVKDKTPWPHNRSALKEIATVANITTLTSSLWLNVEGKGTWGQKSVFKNETHFHKWGKVQEIEPNDSQVHSHFESYIHAGVPNI